jgi:hypothetical protein
MWSLPPLAHACLPPFEQFIEQQIVQLQDFILEHLLYHTLFNMFSNKTFKAHRVWILSCSGLRVGVWLTTQLVFLTFRLYSPIFPTTLCMQFGLPHLSIAGIPWCVCTHPIDHMGIHFLHCTHGNECTWTHDVVCDTFVTITQDDGLHVGWKNCMCFLQPHSIILIVESTFYSPKMAFAP